MTVTNVTSRSGPFIGDGVTKTFPFYFRAASATEVAAYFNGALSAVSKTVTVATGVDGGSVTFLTAPAVGVSIELVSAPNFQQQTDIANQSAFNAETVEDALDRAAVRDISLADEIDVLRSEIIAGAITVTIQEIALDPVFIMPSDYGVVGAVDDTTTLAAMVAANGAKSTFLIPPYTTHQQGVYNTSGITVPYAAEFFGVGMGCLKAIAGAGALIYFTDVALAQDGAQARYVHDMELDGNSATYRVGAYGIRLGGSVNAVVQAVSARVFAHHLEIGHWSRNTQEEQNDHNRYYRNNWGRLVQSDPNNGGATASSIYHCTYQYNFCGAVYDAIDRFALATTGTLSNSSTAVTGVASTAGVSNGDAITGPGIKSGTTVASFVPNTSITLSQATTATAAMANVPLLIKDNSIPYANWTEIGATYQGNSQCGFAAWGFSVTFDGCHFESNWSASPVGSATVPAASARSVPHLPCYVSNSRVALINNCAGGEGSSPVDAWTVVDGSTLIIRDSQIATANSMLINGDLTSSVEFYGSAGNIAGLINIPIARWPDHCYVVHPAGWAGAGIATQTRSSAYANRNLNPNPRVPTVAVSGGAVASYVRDAVYGPVRAVQFAASVGGAFTHTADTTMIGTPLSGGEKMVVSRLIRADTYTTIQFQMEAGAGSFFNYALRVTPGWQRIVLSSISTAGNATAFNPVLHMYPVAADGPKVYIANDMSYVGTDAEIAAIISHGLFDDASIDGALVGTAAWNPGLIAAGASVTTTIAVNGLVAGDNVAASPSADLTSLVMNTYAGTNVINVRLTNPTAADVTPASMTLSGRAHV